MPYAPLSPRTVPIYVERQNLWPRKTIPKQEVEVLMRLGRNAVFIIKTPDHGLFLKQPRDGNCDDILIKKEAALLGALHGLGVSAEILDWNETQGILCLAYIDPNEQSLTLADKSTALATVLKRLHKLPAPSEIAPLPFVMEPRFWDHGHDSAPVFFTLCKDNAQIANECIATGRSLALDGFTHGDAKVQNVLFGPKGAAILIDFELGGAGDPDWDLACLLMDSIAHLLLSSKTEAAFAENQDMAGALAHEILSTYGLHERMFDGPKMGSLLAAAALTFTFQMTQERPTLGKTGLTMFQMAQNGFQNPAQLWESFIAS